MSCVECDATNVDLDFYDKFDRDFDVDCGKGMFKYSCTSAFQVALA